MKMRNILIVVVLLILVAWLAFDLGHAFGSDPELTFW